MPSNVVALKFGKKMKKLSLLLVLLLTGCITEYESETASENTLDNDQDVMPGYAHVNGYMENCGSIVEEFEFNGQSFYLETPIMCDPYWYLREDPGDPADNYLDKNDQEFYYYPQNQIQRD